MGVMPGASVLTLAILVWALYGFTRGIYQAFFHPLVKIPGPRIYAFSDFPYLYHVLRGEWPQTLKKLHDKYGPVVRFTSRDVSFSTPNAWKDIYGHKNNAEMNYGKDPMFYRPPIPGKSHLVNCSEEDHKRMRRLLSHAFSEKALRGQEDVMKTYIDLLITKLAEISDEGQAVDIVQWYNFTTFDLIGDLAFGEPFGCLKSGGYHPWVAMLFDTIKFLALAQVFRRHPYLQPLALFLMPRRVIKSTAEHWKLTEETALRRLETGNTEREDFMSYILRHNDEKGLTTREIIENANILIVAGSETTATLLSGATFKLLMNPEAYGKLVNEVRNSFTSEDEITIQAVGNLKYLSAVFEESFRMYPPVPIGMPRVVPKCGDFVDGYWIPGNTAVSVPQWTANQSEHYWFEPQRFIPERWLGDPRFDGDVKGVLNPFSVGPRNCIGRNLAYAEMRLILTRLLWNFDLELMPESKNWDNQKIYSLWQKGSLKVKLTRIR
ncbi:cytochrome P450 [Xylariales sp. PMI_506]|nr:cytochrome P450 [Xylariales sp. PMI_506]